MPFRDALSKLIRRDTPAASLRERSAALRASIRPRSAEPQSQFAPGSAEAVAAWHAACHEHSIRTAPLHNCPELDRDGRVMWTTASLMRAMEVGEISVAEYARLHPLASERELRFDEIAHELNIGSLFALAYADEYPAPAQSQNAAEPQSGADPIFAVIAVSRQAEGEMAAFAQAVAERRMTDAERDREDAIDAAARAASDTVWTTVPTTAAGLLSLVEYAKFQAALVYGDDWREKVGHEHIGDAFLSLMAAIEATASTVLPD